MQAPEETSLTVGVPVVAAILVVAHAGLLPVDNDA